MLSTSERNAVNRAIDFGLANQVQRIEYGTYQVPSTSNTGTTYTVTEDTDGAYHCDCLAGQRGIPCKHKAAVLIAIVERMSGARVLGPAPVSGETDAPNTGKPRRRRTPAERADALVADFRRQIAQPTELESTSAPAPIFEPARSAKSLRRVALT